MTILKKSCTGNPPKYESLEMAERFAQMKTYSEDKNGRLALYSVYSCERCKCWHVYKLRARRGSKTPSN